MKRHYECAVASRFDQAVPVYAAFTEEEGRRFTEDWRNEKAALQAFGTGMHKSAALVCFAEPRGNETGDAR